MGFEVRIDESAVWQHVTGPGGLVANHIADTARQVRDLAQSTSPIDTGRMRARHEIVLSAEPGLVKADITADTTYAVYQHEGTGVYAGRGPIRPKRAKFLVFTPKGARGPVFAREVKGVRPRPWLWNALLAVCQPRGYLVRRSEGNGR